MAFIPDEAIERMSEVSDSAFKMFVYFCKRRNSKTGICFPSLKTTAKDCGLNYCYASVIRRELVKKGWIEIVEETVINCLTGFGNSKDSLEIPNIPLEIPNSSLEIPNSIYKEVLNQDIQPKKLTNTNTQQTETDLPNVCETDSPQVGSFDLPENGKRKTRTKKQTEQISKIAEDFSITDDMRRWANDKVPTVDVDSELEEFVGFWLHIAVRNNQRTAKGWLATWQGRMREVAKRTPQSKGATNAITKQTNFQTTADRRDERAIAEFQLTESIRARLNSGGNV